MSIKGSFTNNAIKQIFDGAPWMKEGRVDFDAFRLDFQRVDQFVQITMTLNHQGIDLYTFEPWLVPDDGSFIFRGHFPMQMILEA